MRTSTRGRALARIATGAGLAIAAAALFASPAQAASTNHPHRVVFVETDNTAGNSVVAYDAATDGALTQAGVYATGGLGGVLDGSVVDHTASQGSLVLDRAHGLLYAVNAGSNTITVFDVHGDRLVRRQVISPRAVRSRSASPSTATSSTSSTPVTAAPSRATYGSEATSCGFRHGARSLGLDTTLTPEFTNTPAQIGFTPNGSQLVVTTKGNGNDVDVYAVNALGGPAARPTVNTEPGAVPFAFAFDAQANLVVAEAGPNSIASFSVAPRRHPHGNRRGRDRPSRNVLGGHRRQALLHLQRRQRQLVRIHRPWRRDPARTR